MKHRVLVLLGVMGVALAVAGSAFAFDCLRVSSSYQGLVNSTANSGNWLMFDMTNVGIVQSDLSIFAAQPLTTDQATCMSDAYQALAPSMGLPLYFALGFGVAGGKTGNGPGVIAHNNPNTQGQLGNLKGIDHFDASPIGFAIAALAAPQCGVTFPPGG
jgi:hypothetical protein